MAKKADRSLQQRVSAAIWRRGGEVPYRGDRASLAELRQSPELKGASPRRVHCAVRSLLKEGTLVRTNTTVRYQR